MTSKQASEAGGEFTMTEAILRPCPKCNFYGKHKCQTWESSDGGHEDYKYTCINCGHEWWIDGIDS